MAAPHTKECASHAGLQCSCMIVVDSCGCVLCDLNLPVFEGQHIKEDYHRHSVTGERVPCTRKS